MHFLFNSKGCKIMKDGELVIMATYQNGVYGMSGNTVLLPQETPMLCHRRFGHLGFDNLARLQQVEMVTSIKVSESQFKAAGQTACHPCIMAKQHKISRLSSTSDSSQPLELLHMDVCGPLKVQSQGGSRYLSTYLDDFSKLAVICPTGPLCQLSQCVSLAAWSSCQDAAWSRPALTMVQSMSTRIWQISSTARVWSMRPRYTPEQNGAAERLNRTIMERVRAMLEDSGMRKVLWAEAVISSSNLKPFQHLNKSASVFTKACLVLVFV